MNFNSRLRRKAPIRSHILILAIVALVPPLIAISFMQLWTWDFSIPLVYLRKPGDETWQLVLTKMLLDTGWILDNPFLGAPGVAHWHNNAAAQTSAVHSVLMLGISKLFNDSVKTQQLYFLLNFSLISLSAYISSKLLGLARLPAICIAILFSLLGYRFNFVIYAYLSNYFAVPLALVAVFWVMTGVFAKPFVSHEKPTGSSIKAALHLPQFYWGLLFIALVASSDGYYAFFTLLLLGFATFIRVVVGDFRKPASLLAPTIYIVTLITIAIALTLPLANYKKNHPEEFAPNGIPDAALIKHAFEAEIYSSSLKLLVSPSANHRFTPFADIGRKILNTSEAARQFKIGIPNITLGFLGSGLFMMALVFLALPRLQVVLADVSPDPAQRSEYELVWAASVLAAFIFLCSISGGLGTLIALIYPTIRAYDRFPLFLVFVLYVGAGAYLTATLRKARRGKYWILSSLVVLISILSIFDQTPADAAKGSLEVKDRFLAEQRFVRKIEGLVTSNSMIYQYPYSQYLTDSRYYGWGGFGHVRLYLHSKSLRWSNGASKNSPVDNWHSRLARLPIEDLATEVNAAGFSGIVVDRRVLSDAEYLRVKAALLHRTDQTPVEDDISQLTYFSLPDPGYRVIYGDSYKTIKELQINNLLKARKAALPRLINGTALAALLGNSDRTMPWVVDRKGNPDIFYDAVQLDRGSGDAPIKAISDMKGQLRCSAAQTDSLGKRDEHWVLAITNSSDFDWVLNQGQYPLRIGVHIRDLAGSMLQWDNGWRFKVDNRQVGSGDATDIGHLLVPKGGTATVTVSLSELGINAANQGNGLIADFRMVQDGHAWLEHLGCEVAIKR